MASGVEFEEDSFGLSNRRSAQPAGAANSGAYARFQDASNVKGMAGWLMRKGITKSPAAAQAVLVGFIVINVIITFIAIKYFL
jgi:hypothetical protein